MCAGLRLFPAPAGMNRGNRKSQAEFCLFPAPAGMNRGVVPKHGVLASIPRACGDEPAAQEMRRLERDYSPRLRG